MKYRIKYKGLDETVQYKKLIDEFMFSNGWSPISHDVRNRFMYEKGNYVFRVDLIDDDIGMVNDVPGGLITEEPIPPTYLKFFDRLGFTINPNYNTETKQSIEDWWGQI